MKKALHKPSIRQRIKEEIVHMIGVEKMLPGDKILSQNALAERFSTTPVTVHKALTELTREGVIVRRKGVGTFVSSRKSQSSGTEKRVCLIMHRPGLDQADVNPEYWPYMQDIIFAFTHALSEEFSFSMKFAGPQTDVSRLISELTGYHAVFFHYSNEVPVEVIRAIIRSRVAPVIKIGKMQEPLQCLQVENDRFEGMRLGTNHLIGLGHQTIGFVGSSEWWGDIGFAGYRAALATASLKTPNVSVIRVYAEREGGVEAADRIIATDPLPDAVMVDSDLRALGLINELCAKGVRVPEDVSVMSYDGLQFANLHPPYLSSVRVPYGEMISGGLAEVDACNGRILSHSVLNFPGRILPGKTAVVRLEAGKSVKGELAAASIL